MTKYPYLDPGYEVPPLSAASIHAAADKVRHLLNMCVSANGWLDILRVLEYHYQNFEIREINEMPHALGSTLSDGTIVLRSDVYTGAEAGNGRDRFTVAHELGHALLHSEYIGMARATERSTKVYCNSEWQANEFAGALLLPDSAIQQIGVYSAEMLASQYGVSLECAEVRIKKARR